MKPSSISRVKGQAGTEHFSILWNIVIHNEHIEGELTHTIIEWAQTDVGEGTIVTGSCTWKKSASGVCVCVIGTGGRQRALEAYASPHCFKGVLYIYNRATCRLRLH